MKLLCWVLTVALTTSPVLAQDSIESGANAIGMPSREPAPGVQQRSVQDNAIPLLDELGNPMRTPLHFLARSNSGGGGIPNVTARSTARPMSAFPRPQSESNAQGESKWLITAILVGAGIATAVILLLRSGPGTVLEAGQPTVNTPNR